MKTQTKIVRISVKPTTQALKEFATALGKARGGHEIKPYSGVGFGSIEGLRNILTKRRLELLSVVRHKKPQSVYELSKILNRDLKSVNTDLKVLAENEFIEFKKITEGRQRLIPVVEFDKIDIMVKV